MCLKRKENIQYLNGNWAVYTEQFIALPDSPTHAHNQLLWKVQNTFMCWWEGHRGQVAVPRLAQGHFDMDSGGAGDRTKDLTIPDAPWANVANDCGYRTSPIRTMKDRVELTWSPPTPSLSGSPSMCQERVELSSDASPRFHPLLPSTFVRPQHQGHRSSAHLDPTAPSSHPLHEPQHRFQPLYVCCFLYCYFKPITWVEVEVLMIITMKSSVLRSN